MHSCFVTGTDTGAGKTLASASLLHALRMAGHRAVGMKPVASGCERTVQGWRNEDALALQAASTSTPAYEDVNPFALPQPLAPELAAADAGVAVELGPMLEAYARLRASAECVVVEGVGGWAAPLSATLDQIDLVRALDLPVVLVVGLRLGCINHARLTARAIAADGARLIGWIASDVDPAMARADDNFHMLQQRLPVPCWGRLPHRARPDARELAAGLRLPT
ncbi:MAG: Dethiobiotin synthetase [uncultured Lysobacter sp.]|uniref:ATP-dependent dethiobiotin synthetase BioD n=1 Tax=uncultured Lysobacter sp. TaxID=271060 RepID=A0A6J4KT63_9GAMM|nr:MAG: Dethiobiotin synthetase [uncultured Lysobacter sp.]